MSEDLRAACGGPVRTSVEIELRTWNADVRGGNVRLFAVGEPARLARDERGFVAVLVETERGEEVVGTDELRGVLMVRSQPTPEQAELLVTAVEAGYPVEPRIAGDPWPGMEEWEEARHDDREGN